MDDKSARKLDRLLRSVRPTGPGFPQDEPAPDGPQMSDSEFMVDRTLRSISSIAEGAIQRLVSLGWNRSSIEFRVPDDPLPCWVVLCGTPLYEIRLVPYDDGRVYVQGEWLEEPHVPGVIDRIMNR